MTEHPECKQCAECCYCIFLNYKGLFGIRRYECLIYKNKKRVPIPSIQKLKAFGNIYINGEAFKDHIFGTLLGICDDYYCDNFERRIRNKCYEGERSKFDALLAIRRQILNFYEIVKAINNSQPFEIELW